MTHSMKTGSPTDPELIAKYLLLKTKIGELDFHHKTLTQLYFSGWKLFQGKKHLKETDVDHAQTTQGLNAGRSV